MTEPAAGTWEWFEYDCPMQGIDFDVEPLPAYGAPIACSACGGTHIATAKLGTAWRHVDGGELEDITDEWRNQERNSRKNSRTLLIDASKVRTDHDNSERE